MPTIGSHGPVHHETADFENSPASSRTPSVRSASPVSTRSDPPRSESPQSTGHDHSVMAAAYQGADALETKPFHESPGAQEFHSWNDDHSNKYASYMGAISNDPWSAAAARRPLYRAALEHPKEIFQENGQLKSSTQQKKEAFGWTKDEDETKNFSLAKHQIGSGTAYTSTTRDMQFASDFADMEHRPWIYVTDPQPHGRDLNAVNVARGKRMDDEDFLDEQEVSVPGSIHSSEIRGAVPMDEETGKPDFTKLVKNPFYKSPAERFGNPPEPGAA
jgi:hypothetical protein